MLHTETLSQNQTKITIRPAKSLVLVRLGGGGRGLAVRAYATLTEDQSLAPGTYVRWLTTAYNFSPLLTSMGMALMCACTHSFAVYVFTCAQAYSKNKNVF